MKHKTALVSALSIAGVVVAGATALAANLGILNSGNQIGELSAAGAATTSTVSAPQNAGPEVVSYQIAGVGIVTLDRDGDKLSLQSAAVGDWTYEVDESDDPIDITFRLGEREIVFNAEVRDGQTLVSVTEEDVIVRGSTGITGPSLASDDDGFASTNQFGTDDDHDESHQSEGAEEEHGDPDD